MSEEAGENTSTVSFPRADTQEAGAMNGRPLLAIQSLFMSFFLSALPLLPPNPNKKKKKIVFTEGFSIFKHGHTSCLDIHLIPFLFPSFFICHYQLPGIGDIAPEGLQMCGDWRQRRIMACIVIMVIVHFLFKVGICVSFQWWPKCSPPFLLQEKSP